LTSGLFFFANSRAPGSESEKRSVKTRGDPRTPKRVQTRGSAVPLEPSPRTPSLVKGIVRNYFRLRVAERVFQVRELANFFARLHHLFRISGAPGPRLFFGKAGCLSETPSCHRNRRSWRAIFEFRAYPSLAPLSDTTLRHPVAFSRRPAGIPFDSASARSASLQSNAGLG
jgi:hypothetical protein